MNLDIQQCYKYEIKTNTYIVSIKWHKLFLMLHLKAVDDVIRFRVRGSLFHNTAALWLTDLSPGPAEVVDWYKWMLDLILVLCLWISSLKVKNLLFIIISGNNSRWWINLWTKRSNCCLSSSSSSSSVYAGRRTLSSVSRSFH